MPGAIFSRLKNWTAEILTNEDLNAEIDNILDNLKPAQFDDYSLNVAEMQQTTDPGEVGTESLATTLGAEIERLRFAINEIKGTDKWYETADSTIEELANVLGGGLEANRIASGRTTANSSQPIFLVPNGSAATVSLKGASTNFIYSVAGTQYTISTDVTVTGLSTAPSSNNTALVNDTGISDQDYTQMLGEYGTGITIDNVGSEISGIVGQYAAFKINDGSTDEYFLAYVESATKLSRIRRGYFFNSSDAGVDRLPIANNDTITLLKLTWVFAKADGTLAVTYNNPRTSVDQPSSPAVGDYWFDMTNSLWKTFNSTIWVDSTATLIGVCAQDANNCIAARSFDFFKDHSEINTVKLVADSNTGVRGSGLNSQSKVYGATIKYNYDYPRWDMTADLESGVTEAASTMYFFYLKEDGDVVISDRAPMDRRLDLKGLYHPYETWRCIGQAHNDASQNLEAEISYHDKSEENFHITNAVSGSAMTVKLHASPLIGFKFKNATAASGEHGIRQLPYTASLTIDSGATLGHRDATDEPIYPYLIDNTDSLELALSTSGFTDDQLVTTTAMSTSADDEDMFSAAARTSAAIKRFGRLTSNQTTAGTYAAVATEIFPDGAIILRALTTTSSGTQSITANTLTDVTNQSVTMHTTGRPVQLELFFDTSSTNAGHIVLIEGGSGAGTGEIVFDRDSTVVGQGGFELSNATSLFCAIPCSIFHTLDTGASNGSHTFKLQGRDTSIDTIRFTAVKMRVYETLP